jgi:hypothetical protein
VFNFFGVERSLDNVTDGASRTIMLAERLAGNGDLSPRDGWWCEFGVQYSHFRPPNWPGPDRYGGNGISVMASKKPGKHRLEPGPGGWPGMLVAARSRHPGVVVATAADGSVRTVRDDIAPDVWTALGSMDGGEGETP